MIKILISQDYQNIGPIIRDGAIMLEEFSAFSSLPKGYHETQGKGTYVLESSGDDSLFQYTLGPQSFKKFLNPPRRKLWEAFGSNGSFEIKDGDRPTKMAFWGVRNCDLAAIHLLDKIFLKGAVVNEWYKLAREELFIIAIGCTHPSDNCFCTTMNGGPLPIDGFDLSLLEVMNEREHYFLTSFASEKAKRLFNPSEYPIATKAEIETGNKMIGEEAEKMNIRFNPVETSKMLRRNMESKQWGEIAERCLSCANCTMVCPTCFCTSTEDVTDITGDHTERWLRWDSCFNGDFSYIHGGQIRKETRSRYRQWMSHKLSHWYDQFRSSGCVGCGRCITWCPVGIDLTEEVRKMQQSVLQTT